MDPYVATARPGEISGADESSLTSEEPFLLGGLSSTIGQGMPWLVASDTLTATCDRTARQGVDNALSIHKIRFQRPAMARRAQNRGAAIILALAVSSHALRTPLRLSRPFSSRVADVRRRSAAVAVRYVKSENARGSTSLAIGDAKAFSGLTSKPSASSQK